jgi:hypothetical protein
MVRRHERNPVVAVLEASQLPDGGICLQERLRRKRAERENHLRAEDFELPEQEWPAGNNLVALRIPADW